MSSSAGRRDARYIAARRRFQQGDLPCHLCGERPGTTPDHVPPLQSTQHWRTWTGQLLPACKPCQDRQGANLTNQRRRQAWTW